MQLRDYQERAVHEIKAHWQAGRNKVLLWAPTGSGKGVIISHIIEDAACRGLRALFVVRGRELVEQGSRRLSCRHGVYMASHRRYDPAEPVQVCSVDTLRSRRKYPPADIIVVDEVHLATSESYIVLAEHYPNSKIIGVSATPYTTKPLTHLCEHLVCTCTIQDLIRNGNLVGPRYFAPHRPDLSGLSRAGGDYSEADLEKIMLKRKIVADIVKTWQEKGENRPSLCFAVTVAHSKAIEDEFTWAGVTVAHLDANSTDEHRRLVIDMHRAGKIQMIVNVGILHVGVDLPWLSCVVVARPTLSLIWNDQALGRGTRPFPGKNDFLVLDHAGNVHYHGFITDERTPTLIGRECRKLPGDAAVKTCRECFAVFPIGLKICPECGTEPEPVGVRQVLTEDGRLVEVEPWKLLPKLEQATRLRNQLVHLGLRKGWKRGFVWHLIKKQFGEELASRVLPRSSSQELSHRDLG